MLFLHNQLFCLESIGLCLKTSINQLKPNDMKKFTLLFLSLLAAFSVNASIAVCGIDPDDNGHFNCPYIKSGSITWDETNRTLTLDNAVIEYNTDNLYDNIHPILITEDEATIIVHGACRLTTNGYVAISFDSYNAKQVTIQGDGSLCTSSTWIDLFIKATHLTVKDIYLETVNGIGDNGDGVGVALAFDHLQANLKGSVQRIAEGITFTNCSITYPADAYIGFTEGYGYAIMCSNNDYPDHIIISRGSNIMGDVNADGEVNIADVNAIIGVILGGGSNSRADVNCDGKINIADVSAVIGIIMGGGPSHDDHEYVDLGLPSGTLWATCNIGANSPERCGDYFAWGEVTPKGVYSWETYKWCNGTSNSITKYCTDGELGAVDSKTELDAEDDAAYVNWGPSWRMPTGEQRNELFSACTWLWTSLNGVDGLLFTGPNGNTMFLPASGCCWQTIPDGSDLWGYYWTCTLIPSAPNSNCAACMIFNGEGKHWNSPFPRAAGLAIRAVRVF